MCLFSQEPSNNDSQLHLLRTWRSTASTPRPRPSRPIETPRKDNSHPIGNGIDIGSNSDESPNNSSEEDSSSDDSVIII
jgi:hypothetical protein